MILNGNPWRFFQVHLFSWWCKISNHHFSRKRWSLQQGFRRKFCAFSLSILLPLLPCCAKPRGEIFESNWLTSLTRLRGATSTAYYLTKPPAEIFVKSSRAPPFYTAVAKTASGFLPVRRLMISNVYLITVIACNFLPVFLPWNSNAPANLSTIGQSAFLNFFLWYLEMKDEKLVPSCSVRNIDLWSGCADCNIVFEARISDLYFIVLPSTK